MFCLFYAFCQLQSAHLRIHKEQLSKNKKKQVARFEKWDIFQIAYQTRKIAFFSSRNKKLIKGELYQNNFLVYVVW